MSAKKKTKTNLVRSIERYAGKTERWIKNPVPTSGNKSSRGVVFSIRFAIDELENLKERAELQGLSISGLIKRELFEPSKTTSVYWADAGPGLASFKTLNLTNLWVPAPITSLNYPIVTEYLAKIDGENREKEIKDLLEQCMSIETSPKTEFAENREKAA